MKVAPGAPAQSSSNETEGDHLPVHGPASSPGYAALPLDPRAWTSATTAILRGHHVFLANTIISHRDVQRLRQRMISVVTKRTTTVKDHLNHNCHVLVIRKLVTSATRHPR